MSQDKEFHPIAHSITLPAGEAHFVRSVLLGSSPHAAAINAGFAASHAPALLRKPATLALLREVQGHVASLIRRVEARDTKPLLNEAGQALAAHLEANAKAVTASVGE